jgi:hypothetical protein
MCVIYSHALLVAEDFRAAHFCFQCAVSTAPNPDEVATCMKTLAIAEAKLLGHLSQKDASIKSIPTKIAPSVLKALHESAAQLVEKQRYDVRPFHSAPPHHSLKHFTDRDVFCSACLPHLHRDSANDARRRNVACPTGEYV